MKENIKVPTGKVVGIGKLKVFTTEDFPFVIPTLSFIVARADDGTFTATCMQLSLDVSASDESVTVRCLAEGCCNFLKMLFRNSQDNDSAWLQLHELFKSDDVKEFKDAYTDAQLNLSEKGIEIKSRYEKYLEARIQEISQELEIYKGRKSDEMKVDVINYEKVA